MSSLVFHLAVCHLRVREASPSVCEMLAVRSETPLKLVPKLLPWVRLLGQYGVAGFGWGVARLDGGVLRRYRTDLGTGRDQVAEVALAGVRGTFIVA